MKIITPNYYQQFKCIAADCKHNCCIGWEIDVDADTLAFYQSIPGDFGLRLQKSISFDDTPHFILGKQERCPFLNAGNLCDIISTLSEEGLCAICADHPRFRNEFSDRTEVGLGLCCEAAGRLILGQTEKTEFTNANIDETSLLPEEKALLQLREEIFSILQDHSFPLRQRLEKINALCGNTPLKPLNEWVEIYRSLERMDPIWDQYLNKIKEPFPARWESALEKAAVYFTYRHLAGALQDGLLCERIRFIILSVRILSALASSAEDFEDLVEIARLYSAEIEYSDQNIDLLLQHLS